ncbi:hypothetical protein [Serratia sp. UGAL515B_01]|uniref:hypothetical protein n=1 Tax=Serratia sp. UGAL515B_01 TaxID=2986763 RepID=UPI002953184B|nr:hypothetical protein [Serratia sp. UGAL515B_01]WON75542.1 hypothetical protein OK023_00055 [Serratia sp. UGAL515B_01]
MLNFKEQYTELFNVVCQFLGDGWRISQLDNDYGHRIKLTSSLYKNYSIIARIEKGRINLFGSVDSKYFRGGYHSCSVSSKREPWAIANDIRKKILFDAAEQIHLADVARKSQEEQNDEILILKGLLSRLVTLEHYYGALCGFKHEKVSGAIEQRYNGNYTLKIDSLDKDTLIRVVGFLSTL